MTPFSGLVQQGIAGAWLFIPSAVLLGALHGLRPGNSKTMIDVCIAAAWHAVPQAVLLGLAATLRPRPDHLRWNLRWRPRPVSDRGHLMLAGRSPVSL